MDTLGFRRIILVGALSVTAIAVPAAQVVRGATRPPLATEKQALRQRYDQLRADALSAPRPVKDPSFVPLKDAAEPAWLEGIVESGLAPYPAAQYVFINQWQSIVGGDHVNVFAGSYRGDPTQGIVAVDVTPVALEGMAGQGGVYAAPVRSGALRIVSAVAGVLTLESSSGTRITFDIATRGFTVH